MVAYELSLYEFEKLFRNANRYDNFGREGLELLYNYLEDLSDDIGEPIYVDVIGLCCDYNYILNEDVEDYEIKEEDILARGDNGVLIRYE